MVSNAVVYSVTVVVCVGITAAAIVQLNRDLNAHKRWKLRQKHQHEAVSVAETETKERERETEAEQ